MTNLGEALGKIKKNYRCGYCGKLNEEHEDAVQHMVREHVTVNDFAITQ